jgi:hypothetical protein
MIAHTGAEIPVLEAKLSKIFPLKGQEKFLLGESLRTFQRLSKANDGKTLKSLKRVPIYLFSRHLEAHFSPPGVQEHLDLFRREGTHGIRWLWIYPMPAGRSQ